MKIPLVAIGAAALSVTCGAGVKCEVRDVHRTLGRYSVAILGDTHFDAEPESVYHSHYDE